MTRRVWPETLILRHGETAWNRDNKMQGWLNSPLTQKGREQAKHQGDLLGQLTLTNDWAAFCSPQGRAFQTAAIAVAPHIATISTDGQRRHSEKGVDDTEIGTTVF